MATRILAAWYKAGQDQDYPPVTLNSFGQEFKAVINWMQCNSYLYIIYLG